MVWVVAAVAAVQLRIAGLVVEAAQVAGDEVGVDPEPLAGLRPFDPARHRYLVPIGRRSQDWSAAMASSPEWSAGMGISTSMGLEQSSAICWQSEQNA